MHRQRGAAERRGVALAVRRVRPPRHGGASGMAASEPKTTHLQLALALRRIRRGGRRRTRDQREHSDDGGAHDEQLVDTTRVVRGGDGSLTASAAPSPRGESAVGRLDGVRPVSEAHAGAKSRVPASSCWFLGNFAPEKEPVDPDEADEAQIGWHRTEPFGHLKLRRAVGHAAARRGHHRRAVGRLRPPAQLAIWRKPRQGASGAQLTSERPAPAPL
eukprot:COSAG06_NODE_7644_length_2429_cov_1.578112_2_plen_217_part_00